MDELILTRMRRHVLYFRSLAKMWFPLILAAFATTGCVSVKSETDHRIGLIGVWFTNVQTVPYQLYTGDERPQNVLPEVSIFDRTRDPRVILVIAFSSGDSHSLRVVLQGPRGERWPLEWSIAQASQFTGGWRTTRAWWITERLVPGTYLVELTIDALPAGTYVFGVN